MQQQKVEKKKMLSIQMHYGNLFRALRRKVDTISSLSTKPRKKVSDYLKGLLNEAVEAGWDWDKGKELVEKITPEDLINKTPLKEIMKRGDLTYACYGREEKEKNNGEKGDEGESDGEGEDEGEDDDEEENWEDAEGGEVSDEEENGEVSDEEENGEVSDEEAEVVVPKGRGKNSSLKKSEPKMYKPPPKKYYKPPPKKSSVSHAGKRLQDRDDGEIKNIRKKKKEDAFVNKGSGSPPLSSITPLLASEAPTPVANQNAAGQGSGSALPVPASTSPEPDAPLAPTLVANQGSGSAHSVPASTVPKPDALSHDALASTVPVPSILAPALTPGSFDTSNVPSKFILDLADPHANQALKFYENLKKHKANVVSAEIEVKTAEDNMAIAKAALTNAQEKLSKARDTYKMFTDFLA